MKEPAWQPIETAPQGYDGQRFHYVLFYGVSKAGSFNHPVVISGFMDSHREPVHYYSYKLRITHWAPHPSSPTEQP